MQWNHTPLFTSLGRVVLTPGVCVCDSSFVVIQLVNISPKCFFHASTASIKSLFVGHVYYSESGSNNKMKEMATYMYFLDFLEECAGVGKCPVW